MNARTMLAAGFGLLVTVGIARPARAQSTTQGPYFPTPSWDMTVPCPTAANCPRFVVLANFANEAVLDVETGLVWQRSLNRFPNNTWDRAQDACLSLTLGGRSGWRLPSYPESRSLLEGNSPPELPAGHPFKAIGQFKSFWTSTTWPPDHNSAYVFFNTDGIVSNAPKSNQESIWCVRGPVSGAQ